MLWGDEKLKKDVKLNFKDDVEVIVLCDFMCVNFFDVWMFGVVMLIGINCG